ncbi:S8 family serine peptidase [Neobacillus vireti]|uniref:Lactocepin n=1 Tax=Neobacillus vireti LMG 21834 TaxID=1131730 RepID=A0AB94IRI1_9BACI|nr:S8 family serine peptidase [Neobacillus vireti]ETI69656.1 lactocepin [Neobacillus vireti LMG 21834]
MSNKNHNKQRKIATYALASALVLSNFSLVSQASASTTYKPGDIEAKIQQLKQQQIRDSFKKQAAAKNLRADLKATDKVRVIVEVDGQTPVEYATKEGKLYKELSEDKKSSLTAKAESQQKSVKDKIKSKGVNIKFKQNFSTAFNGFSGEIAYGDLGKIESVAGVKGVYLANEYNRPKVEPNMKTSHQFIESRTTWEKTGYKGEGMVVAVIDTGVDPSHRDFKLTDTSKEGLTKKEVAKSVADNGLKGKFYTDKVPFGYNYYDGNDIILDLGPGASMHGMHVAGTVAANGDEAKGGIKGVAPEAQVLAMKVFSNDPIYPSTWSDVYLAAIDDSIKLGADVLNMSLGDVAAFYQEDSAEDLAIQRATANGIVCAMSAGNSNHIGDGWDNPYAKNPDIGVVGAPSLNPDGISVAASGNEAYLFEHNVTVDGLAGFTSVGKGIDDWSKLVADNGGKLELVSLGGKLGSPEDYKGVDVKGKIVLVPRGTLTFVDKTVNAANAGAAGIIVYNATNGFFYDNQGGWDVPFLLISGAEGNTLEAQVAKGKTFINVAQASRKESPEMGRMTSFTSWGTTPSLELKPEITAPGGNIYSTVNNDKYTVMSGTSMASPHVAGGSALVQQYLQSDKRFKDLSVADRTHLAKVLLMNTAKNIDDLNGQPFSPRRQGAGMMQTYAAVTTPAYFVNKATGDAKVELKDFQSKKFEMTFTVKNISNKSVSYKVNTDVLTDTIQDFADGSPEYNALIAGDLKGAKVEAPGTVTVAAGATKDFTVKVDFANAKIPGLDADGKKTLLDLRENIFVEGSVTLEGTDKDTPNLTAPYVGFYGHWDAPEVVDGFTALGEERYYDLEYYFGEGATDIVMDKEEYFTSAVPEKNFIALSPNGDNYADSINPLPAFLRNAKEAQFNILDKNGKQLKRLKSESDVYKNAFDGGSGDPYSYKADRVWDGKINGEAVKDGLYYYEIKTVIDYAGAKWQSKKIPVYVDTTAPKVKSTFDAEKSTVSWETTEDGTGTEGYLIFVNGEKVAAVDGKTTSYKLEGAPDKAIIQVVAWDYAGNYGYDTAAIGDVESPLIFITDGTKDAKGGYVANSPEPWGAYDTKEVAVKGFVSDDIGLKALKVNKKDVEFKKGADGNFHFETTVTFDKDGLYDVQVEATDHSNKVFSVARKVYVDTTKPVINVNAPVRVDKNVDKVTLKVNLQDNFNYLNFYVGENHEFEVPLVSPVDVLKPLSKDYQVTVPLKEGENKVTLKATDLGGNETVKEVVIKRANAEPSVWKLENGSWFYYVDSKKATGWVLDAGKWYYLAKDGKMQTGWVKDGNTWYFLNKSGAMATGWLLDGGKWYFLNKSGAMATGWVKDGKTWYFLNKSGAMATGWLLDGGKWYYLNTNGAMATGWKYVNGKWYYLYSSGAMAANTTVDGYKLGKDGAWIK